MRYADNNLSLYPLTDDDEFYVLLSMRPDLLAVLCRYMLAEDGSTNIKSTPNNQEAQAKT